MIIETIKKSDINDIVRIENAGFNPAEAGSKQAYLARIAAFPTTFLVARQAINTPVIGFVCGPIVKEHFIQDWMYEKAPKNLSENGHQMILTIAVDPDYQGQHVGSKLLDAIKKIDIKNKCQSIALTCLADRIPFYEKNGYKNLGESKSSHAGETWYNMEFQLR